MLLPRALPHTLPLLRCALRTAGLGMLPLLLRVLLLDVLLLLHMLLHSMLLVVMPLLVGPLLRLLLLPLSVLRLSALRGWLCMILATLLRLPVVLPLAVLLLLSISRSRSCQGEKQGENCCA